MYRYQFINELCQAIDFTPILHLTEIRQAVETIYREEFKHNGFWKIKEGKVNISGSGGRFFEKEGFANFSQHISASEIENLIKNMEKQYKKN
ncbi:MAG: hypothetical protein I3270_01510 [Candidatus Moeniiplasma glomeromycotorum]|nr:hypothetical protein [Candidatus Moeniiplasma glomeromycotorum]MCE8162384.1 hypothetical protein [Candidatus Moeniiplasma glomeromycotorum]MCE8166309.1 hypothetical protein [Candidatus Moeniiplasma glomeromycotorum]MCE8166791.1 hypothetical protein [Candidatus Moeniiplasma glomeromycotorum]